VKFILKKNPGLWAHKNRTETVPWPPCQTCCSWGKPRKCSLWKSSKVQRVLWPLWLTMAALWDVL